jgi:hypothetical protein
MPVRTLKVRINRALSDRYQTILARLSQKPIGICRVRIAINSNKKTTYDLFVSGLIMEAAGIEPASTKDLSISEVCTCVKRRIPPAANTLHCRDASCPQLATLNVDLQNVLDAWPKLSQPIREAILTLAALPRG